MTKQLSEKQVLKKLGIPDFRHMTKDKAITLVSVLDHVDPRVAIKALEQFPDFAGMLIDEAQQYRDIILRAYDSSDESGRAAMDAINSVVEVLSGQLKREDLSEDERMKLAEQLVDLAKMASKKDSEKRKHDLKLAEIGGGVILCLAVIAAAMLGVNVHAASSDDGGLADAEDDEYEA